MVLAPAALVHRLVPNIGTIELPSGITSGDRNHFAAELDELLELMTSVLALAAMRNTGHLPSLRSASNETTTAICVGPAAVALPNALVFNDRFVEQMLRVWDRYTRRAPGEASTYLHLMPREYVVGIAHRALVDAIAANDDDAVERALREGARVTAVEHGGT